MIATECSEPRAAILILTLDKHSTLLGVETTDAASEDRNKVQEMIRKRQIIKEIKRQTIQ